VEKSLKIACFDHSQPTIATFSRFIVRTGGVPERTGATRCDTSGAHRRDGFTAESAEAQRRIPCGLASSGRTPIEAGPRREFAPTVDKIRNDLVGVIVHAR
jgi:hypothetical protein